MTNIPNGLKAYLRVPFTLIVWVMDTYAHNRQRLRMFMAQPRTAKVFKVVVLLTVAVWLGIALMANEEQSRRLSDAMKSLWSETLSGPEQAPQ